jgi:TRAP-type uncharacterized transport system fused permease subunit
MQGYFVTEARWAERAVLFAAAVLLVKPGLYTDLVGMAGMALVCLLQRRRTPGAPII